MPKRLRLLLTGLLLMTLLGGCMLAERAQAGSSGETPSGGTGGTPKSEESKGANNETPKNAPRQTPMPREKPKSRANPKDMNSITPRESFQSRQ